MGRRPNNGPTFSKATTKRPRSDPPSPAKEAAQIEQAARDAAKERAFHKDPAAWVGANISKKTS